MGGETSAAKIGGRTDGMGGEGGMGSDGGDGDVMVWVDWAPAGLESGATASGKSWMVGGAHATEGRAPAGLGGGASAAGDGRVSAGWGDEGWRRYFQ